MHRIAPLAFVASLLLLTQPAAAADIGWHGFELHAGVVLPADWDESFVVGGSARLGELIPGLYLYPSVFASNASSSASGFGSSVSLDITAISVGAEVRYFFSGEETGWYAGGGPYVHLLNYDVSVPGGRSSTTANDIGAIAVGGYQWERFGVAARVNAVSNWNGFAVLGTYRFGGE